MRVLLIPSFNIVDSKVEPYVPYGLLSLQATAADLSRVVVDILQTPPELLNNPMNSSDDLVNVILAKIGELQYDIFGISIVCNSAHYSIDLAEKIKSLNPKSLVIAGGPYVTKLAPELLKAFPWIDAIMTGEGEVSFRSLLLSREKGRRTLFGIPGLVTKDYPYLVANPLENLDELAPITLAKDYFSWVNIVRKYCPEGAAIPLEATRGCPLKCSFCSTKQIWGPEVRRKTAGRLINEMSAISAVTGDRFFSLIGDNVGVPRNPFIRFCEELVKLGNPYLWGCSLKLDRFSTAELEVAWAAGCRAMFIGVESASQATLQKVNKAASLENEIRMIRQAIDMGFEVETSFIIGFPWEAEIDIKNTYELHCDLLKYGANRSQVGVLCPIPGTEIVQGHQVVFDGWRSYVAQDDVSLSERHAQMVEANPDLFAHFGHYVTPNLPKVILKAYRDAAGQVAQLHARKRATRKNIEQSNHGRTPDLRAQVYL